MFSFPNPCFKEILLNAPWRGGESCGNCFLVISAVSVHPGTPTDFHECKICENMDLLISRSSRTIYQLGSGNCLGILRRKALLMFYDSGIQKELEFRPGKT